jgi:hypothetical protein
VLCCHAYVQGVSAAANATDASNIRTNAARTTPRPNIYQLVGEDGKVRFRVSFKVEAAPTVTRYGGPAG